MFAALKAYYRSEMARPGIGGLFVNPFYFARRGLHAAVEKLGQELGGRVLDVGCGDRPYETLIKAQEYVGLEIDTPATRARGRADVYYAGGRFPFADGAFDAVLCNQVLEHVFEPDLFVSEIARVLKVGGRVLLTVPFVWDEHEQPRDYARYSSFGLVTLLSRHGLRTLQQHKTCADARALFQLLNAYLYKVTLTHRPYLDLLSALMLMAPVNLIGMLVSRVAPGNPDFYLDNIVLAEKKDPGP
jgi:SAM-dependent methyltransferase